jgi:hypothetical protein
MEWDLSYMMRSLVGKKDVTFNLMKTYYTNDKVFE